MSKELNDKWLELVKAGKAEWVPRMSDQTGRTFIEHVDCGEAAWLWVADDGCEWLPVEGRLPDWSDDATIGALLGQVRERHRNPRLYIEPNGHEGWGLASPNGMVMHEHRVICAPTEAGVCLRALECAP